MTEVREITFRSPILDRFVRMSSWMPSAKNAFSLSSLKFSKGRTAIDLSIFRAEARGRRKKPAVAETMTPDGHQGDHVAPPARHGTAALGWSGFPPESRRTPRPESSAIGKPISRRMMTSRKAQVGNSHAGKTAEASWMMPPATTT